MLWNWIILWCLRNKHNGWNCWTKSHIYSGSNISIFSVAFDIAFLNGIDKHRPYLRAACFLTTNDANRLEPRYVLKICKAEPKTSSCEITHCDAKIFCMPYKGQDVKTEASFILLKFRVGPNWQRKRRRISNSAMKRDLLNSAWTYAHLVQSSEELLDETLRERERPQQVRIQFVSCRLLFSFLISCVQAYTISKIRWHSPLKLCPKTSSNSPTHRAKLGAHALAYVSFFITKVRIFRVWPSFPRLNRTRFPLVKMPPLRLLLRSEVHECEKLLSIPKSSSVSLKL